MTSGTAALYCAACAAFPEASGGGRGAVLVPSHDGIFAFNAATAAGARPVVCDVDGRGLLSEPAGGGAGGAQSIVVHANGRVSDAVRLVEDCAQAIDHHTSGKISTYSFASTKHLTTGGQGGAVCCDDDETFDLLARIKDHGRSDRQHLRPMSDNYDRWGMNFKMTEMQAAFGLAQLRTLRGRTRRFGEMCRMYRDLLGGLVGFDDIEPRWYVDVFTPHALHVKESLRAVGIHCRAYPRPLHLQGVARGHSYAEDSGAVPQRREEACDGPLPAVDDKPVRRGRSPGRRRGQKGRSCRVTAQGCIAGRQIAISSSVIMRRKRAGLPAHTCLAGTFGSRTSEPAPIETWSPSSVQTNIDPKPIRQSLPMRHGFLTMFDVLAVMYFSSAVITPMLNKQPSPTTVSLLSVQCALSNVPLPIVTPEFISQKLPTTAFSPIVTPGPM